MIEVETRGRTAVVTLNRPERLNALDEEHNSRLLKVWRELAASSSIRAVVITGAGDRAFSAGFDLKSVADGYPLDPTPVGGLTKGIDFWKPVIAAVNGLAYGGGLEIVLASDLRVAAAHATFAVPEVRWGLIPGGGGAVRLPYNVPYAIAADMVLRGRVLSAEEALRFGLVNAVVPAEDVRDTALEWAQQVAEMGPLAVRTAKETMLRTRGMDIPNALRLEERMSYAVQVSEDAAEGVRAFAGRRQPRFKD